MTPVMFVGLHVKSGHKGLLYVEVPYAFRDALEPILQASADKHSGFLHITVGTPKKPRTTGPHSQSNHWRGHCRDISAQLKGPGGEEYDAEEIADALKRMAVHEVHYPTKVGADGFPEPVSEAVLSAEQESALIAFTHKFADTHGLWLIETINGQSVKCIGGEPVLDSEEKDEALKAAKEEGDESGH